VNFFKNFWFVIKTKKNPKLTDTKTKKLIDKHNQLDNKLVESLSKQKMPTAKQIKYIHKLLSPRERNVIKVLSFLLVVAVVFVVANSYFLTTDLVPADGGEYTEGLVGSPRFINPILASINDVDLDISSVIFNGLLKYDPDEGLIEDLTEEYSISEDQKTYTFVLRQDVRWHDGHQFTADDVLFTFERIKDPNTESPLYFNFKGSFVEKIDDYTVRFILDEPFAPFLENLTVGILPAHLWKNIPIQNTHLSELNLKPIGTGPYKFSVLTKDNRLGNIHTYTLERNEDFFGGLPHIKKVTFKFYINSEEAVLALNNKNVQAISLLPKDKLDQTTSDRTINFHSLNLPQYTGLFFNPNKNNLLDNTTLRKILAHGVNKDNIIREVLNSQAQKIDSPILPNSIGYTEDFPKYPFDIDYAKKELETLGWELATYETPKAEVTETEEGEKAEIVEAEAVYPFQVRQKNKTYLEMDITTVNQPSSIQIAEMIQKDWQLLGVKVNIKTVETSNIQKEILKNRNYEILLYGEILGYDPDPFPFWHSSQTTYPGLNLAMFANSKADKLLEEARKTTDNDIRTKNYLEFQKILAEEMPAILLFNPTHTYPQTKKLQGFNNHTIIVPSNRLNNIEHWYLKTKRHF